MQCVTHPDRPAVGACVTCGHLVCTECKIEIDDKIYCKTCVGNRLSKKQSVQRLYRSVTDKKLAGVCGGLGDYFSVDSNIVRVIFIIFCIAPVPLVGLIAYIILAILLPMEDDV